MPPGEIADVTDTPVAVPVQKGQINLFLCDTRDDRRGLNPFYKSNVKKSNVKKNNVFFGVVGCGSYGPGGTEKGSLPAIPSDQQIPDFPDCGGPGGLLSKADFPDAVNNALNAAEQQANDLLNDGTCDSVKISIKLTQTAINVIKANTPDNGKQLLQRINALNKQRYFSPEDQP